MKITIVTGFVTLALISLTTNAANIMTISGKLISITPSTYVVESQGALVTIKKNRVPAEIAGTPTKTEVPVSIAVPMDGVERIKPIDGAFKPIKRVSPDPSSLLPQ